MDKGLFPSVTQRSLFNVPNLKSKPWWTLSETGCERELKALEENWKYIRNEAISQMNKKTGAFLTDSEKPAETGDWMEFNLFMRYIIALKSYYYYYYCYLKKNYY